MVSSFDTTLTIRPYNQELPYVGKTYTYKGQQVTVSKINKMEWVYTYLKVNITVENTDISNDDIEITKKKRYMDG
ncbi:GW dipeptide domain-containing protein [Bacillus toyonensis]